MTFDDRLDPPQGDEGTSRFGSEAARIAMTDDAVLALLRQHFANIDGMYLCPTIPGKQEFAARSTHAAQLPSCERVLALFDDTLFGLGDEGFVVTARRVCWKNRRGRPGVVAWQDCNPDQLYVDRQNLVFGDKAIEFTCDDSVARACEAAFHVLAFSAAAVTLVSHVTQLVRASDRPTYQPSAALNSDVLTRGAAFHESCMVQSSESFTCWRCQTALPQSSPRCRHCSAWPSPHGWQRAG